jgi:hypothetical protein
MRYAPLTIRLGGAFDQLRNNASRASDQLGRRWRGVIT